MTASTPATSAGPRPARCDPRPTNAPRPRRAQAGRQGRPRSPCRRRAVVAEDGCVAARRQVADRRRGVGPGEKREKRGRGGARPPSSPGRGAPRGRPPHAGAPRLLGSPTPRGRRSAAAVSHLGIVPVPTLVRGAGRRRSLAPASPRRRRCIASGPPSGRPVRRPMDLSCRGRRGRGRPRLGPHLRGRRPAPVDSDARGPCGQPMAVVLVTGLPGRARCTALRLSAGRGHDVAAPMRATARDARWRCRMRVGSASARGQDGGAPRRPAWRPWVRSGRPDKRRQRPA